MINPFSLFSSSPGNSIQGNNQAGEIRLDHPKTTGHPSNNPFAKIFGDQSSADSSFAPPADTTAVGAQPRVSDLESFLDTLFLSGDVQPYPYRVTSLASDELLPLDASQEGPIVGGFLSPHVFPAGGPGTNGLQGTPTGNQEGLPIPGSSIQTPLVESSLADKGAAQVAINLGPHNILRNAVESLGGETQIESVSEHEKIVVKTLNPLQDADRPVLRVPPPPLTTPQEPLKPVAKQAFQTPLPFEQTPAGIADAVQTSQNRLKYAGGMSSVLSEASVNGKESSIGIPGDLLGEGNVSLTGDRSREGFEATGKTGGIDPNGGQGLNSGMGGSTHSQSGFLHQSLSSSSSGQGVVRMAEERMQDLPSPALQRLQMEVQLSENNRVQIDVGVQHRQVYASLLMDQATLKNLAVQFVPQLEEQLTQGDMELQEFSAEVRDHPGEKESNTQSNGQGTRMSPPATMSSNQATGSLSNVSIRAEGPGLHLVA